MIGTMPIPVVRGKHSAHLVAYQSVVPAKLLKAILGHDPSVAFKKLPEEVRGIYEKVQRKTDADRRKRGAAYVRERMLPDSKWIGAFPAISVCVQEPQKFKPYDLEEPEAGVLSLSSDPTNVRVLVDGLGRAASLLGVINDQDEKLEVRKATGELYLAVTIFAPVETASPLTIEEMQQVFHDFNVLASPVGKGMAIDLDHSDPYVIFANELAAAPVFANHGGIDHRDPSVKQGSGKIATKISLVKFLRAALEGPGPHVDHYTQRLENPNLTLTTLSAKKAEIEAFLNDLANEMGVSFYDAEGIHLTSPGWIALGLVYHDVYLKVAGKLGPEGQKIMVKRIATIDWSTANPDYLSFLGQQAQERDGSPSIDAKGRPNLKWYGGSKAFYNLASYIRYKIGVDALLEGEQYGTTVDFNVLFRQAAA